MSDGSCVCGRCYPAVVVVFDAFWATEPSGRHAHLLLGLGFHDQPTGAPQVLTRIFGFNVHVR